LKGSDHEHLEDGGLHLPGPEELSQILRGFVRESVVAVVSSARDHALKITGREAEAEAELPPNPGRAADLWLPVSVKRILAPAELLVQFMARMRRYHTVAPDGTMELRNLGVPVSRSSSE